MELHIRDGMWQVALDVKARKLAVDSAGVELEVPMDDLVEIGIFAEGQQPPAQVEVEQIGDADTPFHTQKHRIRSGRQTIVVTMSRRPTSAGIDPNRLLSEVGGTADNTTTVKTQS